jgi:hypothetical protein
LLLAVLLGLSALVFAPLNQDEGWYLLAAQRVSQGQLPYRDFAFTQAPLLPFVYQGALPLVDSFGLAGGRMFSLGLALAALAVTVHAARREGGPGAACIAAALLGLNLFQAQYTATVKTYGFAGLALALAASAWLRYQTTRRMTPLVLCALALSLAAATRFSLILFFVPLGLALLPLRPDRKRRAAITFAVAGFAGLLLLYGPFLITAREGLWFGLVEYHAGRQVTSPLLLKAGFLSRVLQSYFPAALAMGVLLLRRKPLLPGMTALAAAIGCVSLLHFLAPFPYDDYQAALYPALALLLAIELPRRFPESEHHRLAIACVCICLASIFSSAQLMGWFAHRQDRIWWRMKTTPDLLRLREVAADLRELAPDADVLFTFDPYLAVEARMDVPPGMEMGPFSYFPDMDDARAKRLNVLNANLLRQRIEKSEAPLAAISGYAFSIASPGITEIQPRQDEGHAAVLRTFQRHYRPLRLYRDFGQGSTDLEILRLRPADSLP